MTSSIARSIQIVQPTSKHAFQLKISDLETILNAEDIRNRNVVVISIAGALRQGKSFLLNFYLQYLYAQVSKTDWSSIRFLSRTLKKLRFFFFWFRFSTNAKTSVNFSMKISVKSVMVFLGVVVLSQIRLVFGYGRKYSHTIHQMATKLPSFWWIPKVPLIVIAAFAIVQPYLL